MIDSPAFVLMLTTTGGTTVVVHNKVVEACRGSCGDEVSKYFALFFSLPNMQGPPAVQIPTIYKSEYAIARATTFQEADELLLVELAVVLQPPSFALLA